jgi:methylenetetrahydrofolate reductase (NADPH)
MTAADTSPTSPARDARDPIARIAAFARAASFETTHLTEAEVAEVKAAALPGCAIYVSAIPSRPLSEQIDTAKRLRASGFEPVPHLAVRNFSTDDAMESHLRRLVAEAGVRRALVIAGDRAEPAGRLHDALAAINTGILGRCGITEIGIAGYPEGHPRIANEVLDRALTDKLAAAANAGLSVRIVTQFTMSTAPILALVRRLRGRGIDNPIGIGLAGPASMATLLRFARICGVKASAKGLVRNTGLLKNLIGASTADPIVRALAQTDGLGEVIPHFFSFGGLPATVRWAGAAAAGHIKLNKNGFEIQPAN